MKLTDDPDVLFGKTMPIMAKEIPDGMQKEMAKLECQQVLIRYRFQQTQNFYLQQQAYQQQTSRSLFPSQGSFSNNIPSQKPYHPPQTQNYQQPSQQLYSPPRTPRAALQNQISPARSDRVNLSLSYDHFIRLENLVHTVQMFVNICYLELKGVFERSCYLSSCIYKY